MTGKEKAQAVEDALTAVHSGPTFNENWARCGAFGAEAYLIVEVTCRACIQLTMDLRIRKGHTISPAGPLGSLARREGLL